MRIATLGRYQIALCSVAALLTGCGALRQAQGNIPPVGAPADAASGNRTFYYTGGEQTFKVPAGVTNITVVARGGAGADSKRAYVHGSSGGNGGRVYAVLPVLPGEKIFVFVGGVGSGSVGGFNGGANGGAGVFAPSYCPRSNGDGGGGASDLRLGGDRSHARILVAAGGGGSGGIG
ncbi:MAG: glycine-rich protein, partial [Candidatus Cybelea sp.]